MTTAGGAPHAESALVISECQRGILDPTGVISGVATQATARGIVPRIARLAAAFRAADLPVVHCHIAHRPDMAGVQPNSLPAALARKHGRMVAGTPDVLAVPSLEPAPEDHVSSRTTGLTAFYGTDLDATLRLRGVRTIVLVGVSADVAVPGLTVQAVDRGYTVHVSADCVAGTSAEVTDLVLRHLLPPLARLTDADRVAAALPGRS